MTDNSLEIRGLNFEVGAGRGPHEHAQFADTPVLCRERRRAGSLKGCRTEPLLGKDRGCFLFSFVTPEPASKHVSDSW